ncbi:Helicase [Zea mays]|uniref:Helicase n=1 Tax=Zea mays TaxID=4577 RepID=A0A1D6E3M6_MAIZE|nr:Helicase [Zea mays]
MLRSHRRLTDSLRCDCAAAVTGMAEIVSSSRDLGVGCLGDFYLYLEDSPLRLSVVVIWVLTAWGHLRGDHSPFCVFDRRYFGANEVGSSKRKYVTMLEFVRRHLHYRLDEPNPYTCYGRLSDQIDVDAYSTIEGNMLQFIASHQSELRSETIQGIADAIDKGFLNADSIGGRVVVPASFIGGRRYHVMNYQDAMAIYGLCLSGGSPCKWYINPDVPEACALMASARKAHSPIKWNEVVSSNQPMPHVPEEQKIACIRDLHPFENKDREFLVTVTIKKIGYRWWYNACKKCTRTTVAHGDSYKCSDQVCATIGTPNQRTRSSPAKTVTKRLFTDIDGGTTGFKDAADNAAAPSPSKDA